MTRFFSIQVQLCLFLFGSMSFYATDLLATTLKVSDNLIVSKVDDQSIEHGFLGKKSEFELAQGTHAIILRYKDVFEDLDFAEERVVESKEFVVKFIVTNEEQLNLVTINIKNLARAQSFSKSPKLTLKNEHNTELEIQLLKIDDYKLAKQINIAVNTLASKQSMNKHKEPALTTPTSDNTPVNLDNNKLKTNNTLLQVNSLAMLKYWWQNASDEEKKYFKNHIILDN